MCRQTTPNCPEALRLFFIVIPFFKVITWSQGVLWRRKTSAGGSWHACYSRALCAPFISQHLSLQVSLDFLSWKCATLVAVRTRLWTVNLPLRLEIEHAEVSHSCVLDVSVAYFQENTDNICRRQQSHNKSITLRKLILTNLFMKLLVLVKLNNHNGLCVCTLCWQITVDWVFVNKRVNRKWQVRGDNLQNTKAVTALQSFCSLLVCGHSAIHESGKSGGARGTRIWLHNRLLCKFREEDCHVDILQKIIDCL